MDSQTIYLAAMVSQATFALTLALLTWSDRRCRGLTWLAGACGLQLLETSLRPLWRGTTFWLPEAAVACVLVLQYFFIYVGLRCFKTRRKLRSTAGPLAVSGWMLVTVLVAPLSTMWSMELARAGALVIMGVTVVMLWTVRTEVLRRTARATAMLLGLTMALFALRLPLEMHATATPALVIARNLTLLCATALSLSFVAMFVADSKRRLHDETRQDALTGLRNRRAMEEMAARQVRMAQRTGRPLALLMMDLDSFKSLNDTWGHSLGDRALRAVGGVLLTATGGDDTVARMGGEEFAVLLPGRNVPMAQAIAERIRGTVAGLRLNEGDRMASFTVSIGVGVLHAGETAWTEMLRRADVALYRAKREGRNRVVLCAEETVASERAAAGPPGVRRHRGAVPEQSVPAPAATESSKSKPALR